MELARVSALALRMRPVEIVPVSSGVAVNSLVEEVTSIEIQLTVAALMNVVVAVCVVILDRLLGSHATRVCFDLGRLVVMLWKEIVKVVCSKMEEFEVEKEIRSRRM